MANLFPEQYGWNEEPSADLHNQDSLNVKFGRSWMFDFAAGEFLLTPTKKMVEADETLSWIMWCEKAVRTPRYQHLIYSRDYGQEYDQLIGKGGRREMLESEIRRMTEEALMVDPRTGRVDQFVFNWTPDACIFSCRITNVREEAAVIEGSVRL